MTKATEILRSYTKGGMTVQEANAELKKIGVPYHLDPTRHEIKPGEEGRFGLLDTGTGTMDKVEVKDGELVGCDCGGMYALCILNGKTYAVEGRKLVEKD